jgi:hypothetical protein
MADMTNLRARQCANKIIEDLMDRNLGLDQVDPQTLEEIREEIAGTVKEYFLMGEAHD